MVLNSGQEAAPELAYDEAVYDGVFGRETNEHE